MFSMFSYKFSIMQWTLLKVTLFSHPKPWRLLRRLAAAGASAELKSSAIPTIASPRTPSAACASLLARSRGCELDGRRSGVLGAARGRARGIPPPRSLAASRCVCKSWRAAIDARQLLQSELLPYSVRGIFFMCHDLDYPVFLAHPSIDPQIFGKLDFHRDPDRLDLSYASVVGHCNGLLLYHDVRGLHVANPATQRRALLPPPPRFKNWLLRSLAHIVFDPAESLHYEVLLVPEVPRYEEIDLEKQQQERDEEWPASTWVLCVLSSRTGQWEERAFVREGEAAGMASDKVMRRDDPLWYSCSAYWHGALFVQCLGGFTVMR
ncbi:hypothetical protein PR202_gb15637 [Eleusine coracana subsp. coracana]|uniref:F-box domain-containing protein n=1 Tax=Eleusine coracana subsp. coracana TaxID=191504 RepID=A0AAV5F016_ELECO|nr:hypothetical protein PR202_gb15637 [Eleusine coracana subsp. coracana]